MDAYASAVAREQTRHYRAALALTDRLRDPKHLAYLRASGFLQKFGIDVDAPGYMDTRRGTLKRRDEWNRQLQMWVPRRPPAYRDELRAALGEIAYEFDCKRTSPDRAAADPRTEVWSVSPWHWEF
jgi:hypothetical protein